MAMQMLHKYAKHLAEILVCLGVCACVDVCCFKATLRCKLKQPLSVKQEQKNGKSNNKNENLSSTVKFYICFADSCLNAESPDNPGVVYRYCSIASRSPYAYLFCVSRFAASWWFIKFTGCNEIFACQIGLGFLPGQGCGCRVVLRIITIIIVLS